MALRSLYLVLIMDMFLSRKAVIIGSFWNRRHLQTQDFWSYPIIRQCFLDSPSLLISILSFEIGYSGPAPYSLPKGKQITVQRETCGDDGHISGSSELGYSIQSFFERATACADADVSIGFWLADKWKVAIYGSEVPDKSLWPNFAIPENEKPCNFCICVYEHQTQNQTHLVETYFMRCCSSIRFRKKYSCNTPRQTYTATCSRFCKYTARNCFAKLLFCSK